MIDTSSPCEYFQSGFVEDYDAWCWPFYIETKQAFPHIILTNPYYNVLNGQLTNYIGTLGKALSYKNGSGSPAQISIDIDLNADDGWLNNLNKNN